MQLTKGQQLAVTKCLNWWKKKDRQVFKIQGRAGTGKTTIAHRLIEEVGLDYRTEVLFMTYVGKATLPLRKQGLLAKTVHSAIYHREEDYICDEYGKPIIMPNGRYKKVGKFVLNESLDPNIKLIVVDEAPMVGKAMSDDIKSFGVPILAMGDRDQLPPVFGKSDILNSPDVILNEIMRQKAGDPIIFLGDLATRGQDIPLGKYGPKCFVVDDSILTNSKIYTKPDIILCGKNKTREKINNIIRYDINKRKSILPEFGDKMVCRKNNWDEQIDDIALINGLFGYVVNVYDESFNGKTLNIDFMPDCLDNQWFEDISLDFKYLDAPIGDKPNSMYPAGNCFEYGYASTVHLAQGSQYGYVLMIEEVMGNESFQRKLSYTGITRAKSTLVLVRPKRRNQSFFF